MLVLVGVFNYVLVFIDLEFFSFFFIVEDINGFGWFFKGWVDFDLG